MNQRIDRKKALDRAAQRIMFLAFVFSVNRPKNSPFWKTNGKFDLGKLKKDFHDSEMGKDPKTRNAASYRLNKVLGIPCDLIRRAIGVYRDESGTQRRPSLEDVMKSSPSLRSLLKVVNSGKRHWKDRRTGNRNSVQWCRKILFKNKQQWEGLMNSGEYDSLAKFPISFANGEFDDLRSMIYEMNNREKNNEPADNNAIQHKDNEVEQTEKNLHEDSFKATDDNISDSTRADENAQSAGTTEAEEVRTCETHRLDEEEAPTSGKTRFGRSGTPELTTEMIDEILACMTI